MSKKTWNEAVAAIRPILGKATSDQRRLIDLLGLDISKDMPRLVIAAKLQDHLSDAIALPLPMEPGAFALTNRVSEKRSRW